MSVIYEPSGRAREYAALATNVYIGCDHACRYCYAPGALQQSRSSFVFPRLREGYLESLDKEAKKLANSGKPNPQILLSFACDPYCAFEEKHHITHQALEILKRHGLSFCVLTKGGSRAVSDLALYKPGDSFATTLTFTNAVLSAQWEPGAALPADRMATLQVFHQRGIETWVSLEPVIDPYESLNIIQETYDYVDLYKVGKLNHHPLEEEIDWYDFKTRAIDLLEKLGKKYYIKQDLAQFGFTTGHRPNRVSREWIEERHMSNRQMSMF